MKAIVGGNQNHSIKYDCFLVLFKSITLFDAQQQSNHNTWQKSASLVKKNLKNEIGFKHFM